MRELYELEVINRFRPPRRPGSFPWHYVLDKLGAEVVSDLRSIEAQKIYFTRNRPSKLLRSPRLAHMRDINEFFCRLIFATRQKRDIRLIRWLGEAQCAAYCNAVVRPDGMATLEAEGRMQRFFFELDRGTQSTDILHNKIVDYDEVAISRRVPRLLLFSFATSTREKLAREILRTARLTVATATFQAHLEDPLGRIWLPVGAETRLSLLDLPSPNGKGSNGA